MEFINMLDQEELLAIADLDKEIKVADATKRLMDNHDFQVFYRNYIETLPLELTYSLGTLEKSQSNIDNVARRLESIALFKKHIEDTVENLNVLLDERNRILNSGA